MIPTVTGSNLPLLYLFQIVNKINDQLEAQYCDTYCNKELKRVDRNLYYIDKFLGLYGFEGLKR